MSYRVTVEVLCDHDGCTNLTRYTRTNEGGMNKTFAAYKAHLHGWKVRGRAGSSDPKVAYCPKHYPQK